MTQTTHTPATGPRRFDPRRIFLGTKWNVLMVVVCSFALWPSSANLLEAFSATAWWSVLLWTAVVLGFAHALWTSARRLWHRRRHH